MPTINDLPENLCWKLGDGRVWSAGLGAFIPADKVPANSVIARVMRDGRPDGGEDELKKLIEFYNAPFGELAK